MLLVFNWSDAEQSLRIGFYDVWLLHILVVEFLSVRAVGGRKFISSVNF